METGPWFQRRLWFIGMAAVLATLGVGWTPNAHAAIRRIQRVSGTSSTAASAATWAQPTKPMNLLVAVIAINNGTGTITPPSGSGWTLAVRADAPSRTSVAIYYWQAAPAQAGTSTWTITGSYLGNVLTLIEYAGAKLSSALDRTGSWGSNTNVSATPSVATSLATSQASEIAVTGWTNDGGKTYNSWNYSFNELVDTLPPADQPQLGVADKVLSATGTATAGPNLSAANDAVAGAIATFREETSTTRYWRCSIQSSFDDNTCWTSTNGSSTNDVPAPDISGTMTAIFNSTGVGDAVIRFDPNLLSLQINSGYTGTVRQMTGGTQGLVGDWYDGINFDTYKGTYIDGPISFLTASSWDSTYGNPRTGGTDGNTFSVRWTGQVYAPVSGSYVFHGYTDDGVRLWVNGTQVINNFVNKGESDTVGTPITLTAGTWYDITLEYYESGGGATCELRWTHPSQATVNLVPAAYLRTKGNTGLQTDWYDGVEDINLTAAAANFKHRSLTANVEIYDANDWDDRIAAMTTDSYNGESLSVAWQGQVLAAYSETYTFSAFSDDGLRVWVNGQLVMDYWHNQATTRTGSPTIAMTAGQWYDLRVEYLEVHSGAEILLRYQSPSQPFTVIPASALRSASTLTLGSFTQAAGSFVGGTGRMDVNGTFSATGGSFTAPTQLGVTEAMTTAGATFTHNSGRVLLESTSSVAFNPGSTNTYNDVHINDGLVGYWNFDETSTSSSSSANDLSGFGHTAYHINTPTSSTDVPTMKFADARSLQFAMATRHGARTPLTPELQGTTALSVSFWYKASQVPVGGTADVINAGENWLVRLSSTGITFTRRSAASAISCAATATTLNSAWHHVAVTHSSATGTTIYFDGVATATCATATYLTAIEYDINRELWFGRNANAETTRDFDGYLDEVRIYKATLSTAEVFALAAGYGEGYAAGTYTLGSNLLLAGEAYLQAGTLDVSATPYNITAGSDWVNMGGRFTARTGTVTLSATTTGKVVRSGQSAFNNLTASGSNGGWTLEDRLVASGAFTQSAGTFSVGSSNYAMTVGNFSQTAGTFLPQSGTVTVTGASTQTPRAANSLYAISIENTQETGLVGYWKFDEGAGTTVKDWSASANDGTASGVPRWQSSGATTTFSNHGSLLFDGVDDRVITTSNLASTLGGTSSLAFWIKTSQTGNDTSWQAPAVTGADLGGSADDIKWGYLDATGRIGVQAGDGTAVKTTSAVNTNVWRHVVLTRNATSGVVTAYLDGVLQATATGDTGTKSTAFSSIGYNTSSTNPWFSGSLDDVRIYSRVLTAVEAAGLAAGRYPSGATTNTMTLGAALTATNTLAIESGKLATSSFEVSSSSTGNVLVVNGGTLSIGTGTVTASGGMTVRATGTLDMPSTGTLSIASGKSLTLDGTLTTDAGSTPTIQSVSGTYAFTVNSDTANPYAVLNLDGLNVKNTDTNGLNIAKATSTTFTKFQNVKFTNGTGARFLYINGDSISLSAPGCSFDLGAGARTTTNNVVVAGTGSRYMFEDRGTATNGIGAGEAYDSDNDNNSTPDGLADSSGSVVQWMWSGKTDLGGSIVGFPTPAFDWATFTYYSTYVAMSNYDGGSTDRIYVRTADGDASYTWDLPAGVGDITGAPRWDTIGGVHYVYVSTTGGYVYKLVDNGSSLALAGSPWNTPYNQGTNATVTSPLLTDANYIYWAGNNTSGNPTLFRLSNASKGTATTQNLTAAVNAALALDTPSASAYVMAAALGHFYRYDVTNNSAPTDSTTLNPAAVDGRIIVLFNQLYAVDNAGKLHVASTTNLGNATWTYQDTTTHGTCTSGSNCQAKGLYVNVDDYFATGGKPRVVFGDKDGHVYIVRQKGGTSTGLAMSGYPLLPNGDTNSILTSALYHGGILVVGNSNGKVYVINAFTASGPATPALLQTYDFGTGVSIASISRNSSTNAYAGAYVIATSNGKLFYIPTVVDGDAFR